MTTLDLSHYSTRPLYNTKAVVKQTGVSAATLRAWERRYGVPEPARSESNYRLYSDRDIALIHWLQRQIEEGVTISQAVALYEHLSQGVQPAPPTPRIGAGEVATTRAGLIAAFRAFDETVADRQLAELFALYPVESVLLEVIAPTLIEVGELWHSGELSVPVEHFASTFVQRKLMTLMNAQPNEPDAPLVIAGCAPHELHEIGILLLSVLMRRAGLRVIYLGANVPVMDLGMTLKSLRPAALALSASTPERGELLAPVVDLIAQMDAPRPSLFVGGAGFVAEPALVERLSASTLPAAPLEAVHAIAARLRGG